MAGCCQCDDERPAGSAMCSREVVAVILSLCTWVLMPKCPACVAAYVALWAGIGLSFAEAANLRWLLLALSGIGLTYVAAKRLVLAIARAKQRPCT